MSNSQGTSGRGWGYVGALLGGAVSIAANVAHSYVAPVGAPASWRPPLGDVLGAVFWPVALFVAIEILARTSWPSGKRWIVVRFAGLLPVAVVAALVSYGHLSGLLAHYGESKVTSHLGPLAVDGLMVMASAALMATAPQRAETAPVTGQSAAAPVDTATDIRPDTSTDTGPDTDADTTPDIERTPRRTSAPKARRRPTADRVAALVDKHPDITVLDMSKRLGVTERTVRRHLSAQSAPVEHANGAQLAEV